MHGRNYPEKSTKLHLGPLGSLISIIGKSSRSLGKKTKEALVKKAGI